MHARLDDELRAFVAGEERRVDAAPFERGRVLVEDGVHLRMADVSILLIAPIGNEIENFRSGASN